MQTKQDDPSLEVKSITIYSFKNTPCNRQQYQLSGKTCRHKSLKWPDLSNIWAKNRIS
jgi:hypothetical protein